MALTKLMDYVQEHQDKLMADPEKYIELLRKMNTLHCVWHLELQEKLAQERVARHAAERLNADAVISKRTNLEARIESLEAEIEGVRTVTESVAATMDGYADGEFASANKLHRYAQELRKAL